MANQIYVPLKEAAKRNNVDEKVLTQLIAAGMIEAKEEAGETLVAVDKNGNGNGEKSKTKEEIIDARFADLKGQPISASEASRQYSKKYGVSISHQSFSRWAKQGYITVIERGYRLLMDRAEAAYCAETFAKKYREYEGKMSGVHIFDKKGNPYQLKYPEVAEQMRLERQQARERTKDH